MFTINCTHVSSRPITIYGHGCTSWYTWDKISLWSTTKKLKRRQKENDITPSHGMFCFVMQRQKAEIKKIAFYNGIQHFVCTSTTIIFSGFYPWHAEGEADWSQVPLSLSHDPRRNPGESPPEGQSGQRERSRLVNLVKVNLKLYLWSRSTWNYT